MPNLTGPTAIVIILVVLLLFGAPKLPALARSLGQSMKILKKEVTTPDDDTSATPASEAPSTDSAATSNASEDSELERVRAEAAAARAEAEALRAAAERRNDSGNSQS